MRELDDETTSPGQALRRGFGVLRRRKWPMLLTLAAAVTAAASTVAFLPDEFRSTATVIIERQQIPDELVRSTVTSALEVRLQTITQRLLSSPQLAELMQDVERRLMERGLFPGLFQTQSLETDLERIRDNLQIGRVQGGERTRRRDAATIAFTVSYDARDPDTAAEVAATLSDFFVDENLIARERVASGTAEFLTSQLEQAKAKLDNLELEVSQFKQAHMGSLPQQLTANLAALEQLNSQLRVNSDRQIQNGERRAALEAQLLELQGASGEPRTPDERLAMLQRTLTQLRTRYSEKHPDVVRARTEIAALEQLIREAPEVGGPLVRPLSPQAAQIQRQLSDLEVEARTLVAEAQSLRGSIALYQNRVELTPSREQAFASVAREYENTQELYRSLVQRQREAELAQRMERRQQAERFWVVDPALPPPEPTGPPRGMYFLLGLLGSFGLAFAVGAALEVLDPSLHDIEDVKAATSIPVIATIPRIVTAAETRSRRRRLWWGAVVSAVGLLVIVGVSFLLTGDHGPVTVLLMD